MTGSLSECWMTVDVTHYWKKGVPRVWNGSREDPFAKFSLFLLTTAALVNDDMS